MKKAFCFFLLIVIVLANKSKACINGYELIPGIEKFDEEFLYNDDVYVNVSRLQEFKNQKLKQCEKELTKECIDLVVAYLYLKDYKSALELAEKLHQKFPKEYNVVITYAASLELNGKLADALKYIKEAIKINPDSHEGSELIHVKIIEDLAGISKNEYSASGFDFGLKAEPEMNNYTMEERKAMLSMLTFQISERKYFIPGHNPAFGKLIFDYANLLYVCDYISISREFYEMAERYGYTNELVTKRKNFVNDWVEKKYRKTESDGVQVEENRSNEKSASGKRTTFKSVLKNLIPILAILGAFFVLWYRNKMYRDYWKK